MPLRDRWSIAGPILKDDTMRTRRMSVIAWRSVITYDFSGLSVR
jgi:hypothetical protein